MAVNKRKRQHKVSKGIHGATKHPLSEIEKALADKGLVQSIEHVPCKVAYRGATEPFKDGPWSPSNVEENKRLYPHLFPELKRKRA